MIERKCYDFNFKALAPRKIVTICIDVFEFSFPLPMAAFQIPGPSGRQICSSDTKKFSPTDLRAEVNHLLDSSLSPSTRQSYSNAIKTFEKFRVEYQLHCAWPPPLFQVIDFIAYLSVNNFSHNTARLYMSGISYKCKILIEGEALMTK